jgi:propionyl-CoA synthetase
MEEVLAAHQDVAGCAVVGVADDLQGEVPLGLVLLKAGTPRPGEEIVAELTALCGSGSGPSLASSWPHWSSVCPRPARGKSLAAPSRRIADGIAYRIPPTIDDPAILDGSRPTSLPLGILDAEEQTEGYRGDSLGCSVRRVLG